MGEHIVWTVDSTSYLRNLDSEDLRAETIAVHHQSAPEKTETGTRISLRFPTLIVSGYCAEPREVADRVARILNAHWDEPAASPTLLEVLEGLVAVASGHPMTGVEAEQRLQSAIAAIALATGKDR